MKTTMRPMAHSRLELIEWVQDKVAYGEMTEEQGRTRIHLLHGLTEAEAKQLDVRTLWEGV